MLSSHRLGPEVLKGALDEEKKLKPGRWAMLGVLGCLRIPRL